MRARGRVVVIGSASALAAMALAAAAWLAWGRVKLGLDFEGGAAIELVGDAPLADRGLASVRERVARLIPDPARIDLVGDGATVRLEIPAIDDEGAARVVQALAGEPLGIYAPADPGVSAPGTTRWLEGEGNTPRVLVALPAVVSGADVASVEKAGSGVTLRLTPEGTRRFADLTRRHVGAAVPVALGDRILMAPVVREPIEGGELSIDPGPGVPASELARRLRAGVAPALRSTSVAVIHPSRDPRLGRPLAIGVALAGAALALAFAWLRRRALLVAAAAATTAAAVIAWATWYGATFNLQLHVAGLWLALPVAVVAARRGWPAWLGLVLAVVAALVLARIAVHPSSSLTLVIVRAGALVVPASSPVAFVAALLAAVCWRDEANRGDRPEGMGAVG